VVQTLEIRYAQELSSQEKDQEEDKIRNSSANSSGLSPNDVNVVMSLQSSRRRLLAVTYEVVITYLVQDAAQVEEIKNKVQSEDFSNAITAASNGNVTSNTALIISSSTPSPTPVARKGDAHFQGWYYGLAVIFSLTILVALIFYFTFIRNRPDNGKIANQSDNGKI